jgi:putative PIN family toxin of toxin-antitoxin system
VKVFLDTNVLASALGTRGLCADLLRDVVTTAELVVSDPLFIELRRILQKKFHVPEKLTDEMIAFLKHDTIIAPRGKLEDIDIKDEDDIIILSSAIRGATDVFVTGDKEVLALKKIGVMEILSPREFWDKTHKKRA